MMLQKKSKRMAAAKCLYAIPLVALAMALFASPALSKTTSAISKVEITNFLANNQIEPPQYSHSEEDSEVAVMKPSIVVNGEFMPNFDVNTIDVSAIESIDVIKKSEAIDEAFKTYNITGNSSNGVMIIKLKDGLTIESATIVLTE